MSRRRPPAPPPPPTGAAVDPSPVRVLAVAAPAAALARVEALQASGETVFEFEPCAGLDAAVSRLGGGGVDAVLLAGPASQADALCAWAGLSQAVAASAVLWLVDEGPAALPAEAALRLTQLGVQDLLGRDEAAPVLARRLRLAVERDRLGRQQRRVQATDPSTGLPTRQQLVDHMHHLIALREREPAPMGLLVLRVEGLLTTEATLGPEGAALLRRKLAVRLRGSLRASDVVASLGADIFGVLLSAIDRPEHVEQVSAKLQAALRRPFSVAGQAQSVAVSVGLSLYPEDGADAESLLRDALAVAAGRPVVGRVGLSNWKERGGVSPPAANDE